MKKNIAIAILCVTALYLCAVIIKLENQRYALSIGMCQDKSRGLPDMACISKAETRTSPIWHLVHALSWN